VSARNRGWVSAGIGVERYSVSADVGTQSAKTWWEQGFCWEFDGGSSVLSFGTPSRVERSDVRGYLSTFQFSSLLLTLHTSDASCRSSLVQ
jgi:hypothetical protein